LYFLEAFQNLGTQDDGKGTLDMPISVDQIGGQLHTAEQSGEYEGGATGSELVGFRKGFEGLQSR
jgi:hypothetical protein